MSSDQDQEGKVWSMSFPNLSDGDCLFGDDFVGSQSLAQARVALLLRRVRPMGLGVSAG